MRIELFEKEIKRGVNLTNGEVQRWVPVYTGSFMYYFDRYEKDYTGADKILVLEIKRK